VSRKYRLRATHEKDQCEKEESRNGRVYGFAGKRNGDIFSCMKVKERARSKIEKIEESK